MPLLCRGDQGWSNPVPVLFRCKGKRPVETCLYSAGNQTVLNFLAAVYNPYNRGLLFAFCLHWGIFIVIRSFSFRTGPGRINSRSVSSAVYRPVFRYGHWSVERKILGIKVHVRRDDFLYYGQSSLPDKPEGDGGCGHRFTERTWSPFRCGQSGINQSG